MSESSEFVGSTSTVIVLRETYNEPDPAPRPNRVGVRGDLIATWLPELRVLHVRWEASCSRWEAAPYQCAPEIDLHTVADHSAAVRKAVEVADQVKLLLAILVRDKDVRARVLGGMALTDVVRATTTSHDPRNL